MLKLLPISALFYIPVARVVKMEYNIRKESGFFQIVYILILNNMDLSMKKGNAISSIQHACMHGYTIRMFL